MKPVSSEPVLHKRSHHNEKPTHHDRVAPLAATREKPGQQGRPSRDINKYINNLKNNQMEICIMLI